MKSSFAHHCGEDGWSIHRSAADARDDELSAAIFTLGDGFIGLRGVNEECPADARPSATVYLNGVYETVPIHYHEKAHGFAETSDTRVPAADPALAEISIDGEVFSQKSGTVLEYEQHFCLRTATLTRSIRWRSPKGRHAWIKLERLVSLALPGCVAFRWTVVPLDDRENDGEVEQGAAEQDDPIDVRLVSSLAIPRSLWVSTEESGVHDPRLSPKFSECPWIHEKSLEDDAACGFVHRTAKSGIGVAAIQGHTCTSIQPVQQSRTCGEFAVDETFDFKAAPGQAVEVTKYIAYATDRGTGDKVSDSLARDQLTAAVGRDFDALVAQQRRHLDAFWETAAIELMGADVQQLALRFAIFQIYQAVGRDGATSVGAKGQTGEGYEGHYFWDAEIFTLPAVIFTVPDIAREMLHYRYTTLDRARDNAKRLGHDKGALFAWRTISGRECSAYFPAGSAQYHINADVAHAICQYVRATGDDEFLRQYGVEMLAETARIWAAIGYFNPRKDGRFCIHEVTGPDEYSALVDNNFYTNWMAREHLLQAAEAVAWLKREHPGDHDRLVRKIGLGDGEADGWRETAGAMYLPYDEDLGVYLQDDGFADRKPWDFAATSGEHYPLLLHFHPMVIYRHKVCKQADALMAFFLHPDAFKTDDKRRSFDYYEAFTVHDSTLSACIFSSVASEIGALDKSWRYFCETALVDLEDRHHNTDQGLHVAAMGGSWMALTCGFAGMRIRGDQLAFHPVIPDALSGYAFRIRFRGRLIKIEVSREEVAYTLLSGGDLSIIHDGDTIGLTGDTATRLPGAARVRRGVHPEQQSNVPI